MAFFYKNCDELEKQINTFFSMLENVNKEEFAGKLTIVLLGSLSRGEATWDIDEMGKYKILSDIEFFTVFPNGFRAFDKFSTRIDDVAKMIFSEQDSNLFHIDNTYVSKSLLPKLERKLLTYDGQVFGKCVVGEDVMHLFPEINLSNINLCDIEDILTHRIFSVLYYGLPIKKSGNLKQYRYSLAKNSLDLMTVLLVINGILESGFKNRYVAIQKLNINNKYKEYLGYCLSIKFSDSYHIDYTIEEMEQIFLELINLCSNEFQIPLRNIIVNYKYVLRRRLGMIKRMFIYRNFAFSKRKHLCRLLLIFKNKEYLGKSECKDNLVLHGYPV